MCFVICLENVYMYMRGTYEIHKKRELPHIIQMILQQFLDFHTHTLPTKVDPVKDSLVTSGLLQRTFPTWLALSRELVTTFSTPAGIPACLANCSTRKTFFYIKFFVSLMHLKLKLNHRGKLIHHKGRINYIREGN